MFLIELRTDCTATSRTDRIKVHEDAVYCPEGASFGIWCYLPLKGPCTLDKADTIGFVKSSQDYYSGKYILYTASLERRHAGNYTVTCPKGKRTIQLYVLCKLCICFNCSMIHIDIV